MEDIGNAIIMAGQALMFVFALSIAIFLYNNLMVHAEEVADFTGAINRGDAITSEDDGGQKRVVSRAEVILAILDLKENTFISEVKVGNHSFKLGSNGELLWKVGSNPEMTYSFDSSSLRTKLLNEFNSSYELSHSEGILRYE